MCKIGAVCSRYLPFSFWETQDFYCQMMVEKIDVKSLFDPVCAKYNVPFANGRGSADINSRAAMMRRFAEHEAKRQQCVLLYAGDHDPAGLRISDFLPKNLADLSRAVGWRPDNLIVDRFGLTRAQPAPARTLRNAPRYPPAVNSTGD